MRRFSSLFLSIVLCLALAAPALAADGGSSGSCGDNLTWTLGTDGTLTIGGTGSMYDYEFSDQFYMGGWGQSSAPWYFYWYAIKEVVIEEGVTSIGEYAFFYCEAVKSVTIPKSVVNIGDSAFNKCTALTHVYYGGNEALWNSISMGSENEKLTAANIQYNSEASEESGVIAVPTPQKVLVNGKNVSFDAYNIGGSNYFKIRDLAYTISGTLKQFEVAWDGTRNAISIVSGAPYTAIGSEMSSKGAGNKITTPTNSIIYLDGVETSFSAYNIDGNNYFKLRDVGEALGFIVEWDEANKTIIINSKQDADAWRRAYALQLQASDQTAMYQNAKFSLLDIDSNGIPEIFVIGPDYASGMQLLAFDGQQVNVQYMQGGGAMSHLPGTGIFMNSGGHQGVYSTSIYRVYDGKFTTLFEGMEEIKPEAYGGDWTDPENFNYYIFTGTSYANREQVSYDVYMETINAVHEPYEGQETNAPSSVIEYNYNQVLEAIRA